MLLVILVIVLDYPLLSLTILQHSLLETTMASSTTPLTASACRKLLLRHDTTCLALGLRGEALCHKCLYESNKVLGYSKESKALCCEQPWRHEKRHHRYTTKRKAYVDSWKLDTPLEMLLVLLVIRRIPRHPALLLKDQLPRK